MRQGSYLCRLGWTTSPRSARWPVARQGVLDALGQAVVFQTLRGGEAGRPPGERFLFLGGVLVPV